MGKSGPGRAEREGLSIFELTEMFPDEDSARKWFETIRWADGERTCPRCEGTRTSPVKSGKPMPYWCTDCRKYFSVKVGTIMESSNLPLRKWVMALYLLNVNLKGVSSMKLHRDLGVTQKTAWMMAQKIRECWLNDAQLSGEVEVDETFIGGRSRNMHKSKRLNAGRGIVGKAAVVGAKERNGRVKAQHVPGTDTATLQGFVHDTVEPGSTVYTDEHHAYRNLAGLNHKTVKHSAGEYVRGMAHTNGIESFWATLKRGYVGTYHNFSVKHLSRYVNEFAGRANVRDHGTLTQMMILAAGMVGKRMRWQDLTA